jgi:glycosyltransferase involved in cell wall biosynthesis
MPDQHLTLDERLASSLTKIGSADVVVGIPSFRNAATIGYVATTAAEGLREHFPGARVAIVNADGGSEDGTPDRGVEGASGVPVAVGRYIGPPGKGSAFRAIFTAVGMLGARACAVVDSDLRSITPEWIGRLLTPIT